MRGNALQYSLNFDGKAENGSNITFNNAFEQHIYHTARVDYSFQTDSPSDQDMTEVVIGDGYLIGLNRNLELVFMSCRYPGIANVVCQDKGRDPYYGQTPKLNPKTNSFDGLGFAWVTAQNFVVAYIFNGEEIGSIKFTGEVSDIDVFRATDN